MHVAIGVLCGPTGGPATYGRRLAAALRERGDVEVTVITDRPDAFEGPTMHLPMRGGVDRLRWQHWALPRALRELSPDLYHDTKNALPIGCPVPAVATVHDLAYYRCPETFGFWSRTFLRRATSAAVRGARRVIVPSQATADDVASIYPEAAARTRVVPHGFGAHQPSGEELRAAVLERHGVARPFLLHVGTIQARKNVDLLVRAVRQIGDGWRVVLAGRRGWLSESAFAEIEADDTALWLGEVSDGDLGVLYDTATAFVSPSAYEGFGFTVADALAAGLPCVISDVSSLPEVCGDAAVKIAELTVDGVAAALRELLGEPDRLRALSKAGRRRAAEFSWESCGAQTVAVYGEALGGS